METVLIRSKPYILGRLDDQPFLSPLVVALVCDNVLVLPIDCKTPFDCELEHSV